MCHPQQMQLRRSTSTSSTGFRSQLAINTTKHHSLGSFPRFAVCVEHPPRGGFQVRLDTRQNVPGGKDPGFYGDYVRIPDPLFQVLNRFLQMTKVWQPVMVSPYTLPSRDRTNLPLSGRQCWFQEGIYYVVLCRDYILSRETKRILEVLKKIRMTHGMASFFGGFPSLLT